MKEIKGKIKKELELELDTFNLYWALQDELYWELRTELYNDLYIEMENELCWELMDNLQKI